MYFRRKFSRRSEIDFSLTLQDIYEKSELEMVIEKIVCSVFLFDVYMIRKMWFGSACLTTLYNPGARPASSTPPPDAPPFRRHPSLCWPPIDFGV